MEILRNILDTIFSIPYVFLGILITALLDLGIHRTRSSERFTLMEIWGCTMLWPLVVIIFIVAFFKGED